MLKIIHRIFVFVGETKYWIIIMNGVTDFLITNRLFILNSLRVFFSKQTLISYFVIIRVK